MMAERTADLLNRVVGEPTAQDWFRNRWARTTVLIFRTNAIATSETN